ncbi:hypothetical protein MMC13_002994 [Lambiella insularis]|nr:hypothetical protein [Lambiella insularis]
MLSIIHISLTLLASIPLVLSTTPGYRTIGSSGCAAQMVFVPPLTATVVFIDNYHANYGGPGVNLTTGAPSPTSYTYDDGSGLSVFGTEYDLLTNGLRPLRPLSNTFCSAGSFFADGTLLNVAGAEAGPAGVAEGFNKIRTYAPGPCAGDACKQDWVENSGTLQHTRWYPSAQTLVDGSVLVVGGADAGGLVLNEASINVPTYETVFQNGQIAPSPVSLPILNFTAAQNLDSGLSYNLYPILHLLPNEGAANHIFTVAGNQTVIWDYTENGLVATLPDTPLQPRTFPSSATSVLLPLVAPGYTPTVMICGGSSGDMPNPLALDGCYTIHPLDPTPVWQSTDSLPNGPQTMSDGVLLPDGTILIINGARVGCGGGFMGDSPVLEPVIYNSTAPAGDRFTTMPGTTIPRLYHSVAILLPSGEVLVAGSNPAVGYSSSGTVPAGWPIFYNNGHQCALQQQQQQTSAYPTEYRVEIFSPPYMAAAARPLVVSSPASVQYNVSFQVQATLASASLEGYVQVVLSHPGFHTHGTAMGQRMVMLSTSVKGSTDFLDVTGPRDASVMPPGVYLLFVVGEGIPSEGVWVELGT